MNSPFPLLLIFLSLLHQSTAVIHHRRPSFLTATAKSNADDAPPTAYFEVTKPIKVPETEPCSYLVLHHDFGYTYGRPPVLAPYEPPSHCPSKEFSTIVLEWSATCKGRQYDRIFGVWLGGVELLRSCTAEPRANGIVWKVQKDITRYYSLLMSNQTLAVYLGNLVTSTYTGIYHVDITIKFYPVENKLRHGVTAENLAKSAPETRDWADLIMPISRSLPLNDGLWFEIENSTGSLWKEFEIPRNVYRAVLEVYVSFHENDESWYTNLPNDYIEANNLSGMPGNGPFREVVISLDGEVVGAIWPFTVIYTGGINPLLWRPITAIGSFDLPTYDIEITPFLGKILDGKTHKLEFSVTNALNVWYIDANLHLWLDKRRKKTKGKLLKNQVEPLMLSSKLDFHGLDGNFLTNASRSISSTGWVKSSHGKIITHSDQNFKYANFMVMGNDANLQTVNQTIDFNTSVMSKTPSSPILYEFNSYKKFPLYLYTDEVAQGNNSNAYATYVTLKFDENKVFDDGFGSLTSSLNNLQSAHGNMVVKNNLVVSGLGSTHETYNFNGGSGFCYFRNVSSSNYTILFDEVSSNCSNKSGWRWSFQKGKWWRRA
ncbi:hypothetical protein Nepgr_016201 [Nepenthes gracilis]|uniref:Peptide N-acetyl-beta-D-glucosaminyl asparaginase amidase A N-terminal domain-containing protein n=1 Tax=Nepenthes gracilis TaxID=150966 RepID=A0AAD3SM98_NEPGR|nr:hypothetical protein Nepgr_016201 [Nepenthes gracilis]